MGQYDSWEYLTNFINKNRANFEEELAKPPIAVTRTITRRFFNMMTLQAARFSILAIALGAVLLSCPHQSGNSGSPDETLPAEYTVMLYGAGGETLDGYLVRNLNEILSGSRYIGDKVRFTAQINWSKKYQTAPANPTAGWGAPQLPFPPSLAGMNGTQRFHLEPRAADFSLDKAYKGAGMKRLDDPATLADYILWTSQRFPAEKYILILWNHGSGWYPEDDIPFEERGRAIIYDDNFEGSPALSSFDLAKGIADSGVAIETVYYDACLMNMLENLGELVPDGMVKYTLGTGHTTPAIGGAYTDLLRLLYTYSDTGELFGEYCGTLIARWRLQTNYADVTFTELSKLPPVFDALKQIAERLIELYSGASAQDKKVFDELLAMSGQNQQPPQGGAAYVYFYDFQIPMSANVSFLPSADIYSYVKYLADKTGDPELAALCVQLGDAAEGAILHREKSARLPLETSFGVSLLAKDTWNEFDYRNGWYEQLYFDRRTGWSAWLNAHYVRKIFRPNL